MAALESMPAKGKTRRRSVPRIDMTPMVDLAFLLLTFFVMTTTLMKNHEMVIKQPAQDESGAVSNVKDEQVLNLVLAANNKVYWYMGMPGSEASQTNYSSSGIRKLLTEKKNAIKGLYVFIKASDQSRYENTVDVLDEIIISNINNYSLVSLDVEDRKLVQ